MGHIILNEIIDDDTLRLSTIELTDEYRKEWNIHCNEFLLLSRNGQAIRNTLYRKGMFGGEIKDKPYFMLLKYTDHLHTIDFLKSCNPTLTKKDLKSKRKHLESNWVILDSEGNEKVSITDGLSSPYLVDNSCIYSIYNKYYNIETGYYYGKGKTMESDKYLFLDNSYGKSLYKTEHSKGILKIDKKTGEFEIFPIT